MLAKSKAGVFMAVRPADGRNPDKTKLQAQSSKEKVAIAKANQLTEWQKQLAKTGRKIDDRIDDMNKRAKKIGEMMKKREDFTKAMEDLADLVQGTIKELKEYTEVPTSDHLPKMPSNAIGLGSILPVIIGLAVYWKAVRLKLK